MKAFFAAVVTSLTLIAILVACGDPGFADLKVGSPSAETIYRSSDDTISPETVISDTVRFETVAPETDPPVTEPLVTEPPETDLTETEPIVTQPPVTESPETEPPVTEPETTAPETTAETTAQPRTTPSTDTVYWVKNGEVWHLKESCSSLSRSKNIQSGSVDDAKAAGKDRVCKRCGK